MRIRFLWFALACSAIPLAVTASCAGAPPRALDDLCGIFAERESWHRAAQRTRERWGVPEAVQLAILHQESRFVADARPPRRRLLGFLPGPRRSSAYGYAQAKDGTWDDYRRATGRRGADRDDFGDAVDFVGWYARAIGRATGVRPDDARQLYLAYHEGPTGYRRQSWRRKPWLLEVAGRVEARARRYAVQHERCPNPPERWLGIF